MAKSPGKTTLRVLYSVPPPSARSNPYTTMVAQNAELYGVEPLFFSWRYALFGKYDLFHIHWPETMVRGETRLRAFIRSFAGVMFIARLSLSPTPVVATVHNLQPHERGGRFERWFCRRLARRTGHRIYINNSPENHEGENSSVILHGEYRSWYLRGGQALADKKNDILFFGQLRPYKGLETLIAAFRELQGFRPTMAIVGNANDSSYADSIRRSLEGIPNVNLDEGFADEDKLVRSITQSSLVVLPYSQMYNSGALLLALSLGTPVLAPDTPANRALFDEFGRRWVKLFHSPISAAAISEALEETRVLGKGEYPSMQNRQWNEIGLRHAELYQELREAGSDRHQPSRAGVRK